MTNKVVFILGPTGVGKTEISIKLAKKFNGEIISADSVQVFKGLDIGSAKIKKSQMQNVVHHCIDIKDAKETFSAFEYVQILKDKIKEISSRGKLPFVVGGTGLYIKSLILGYNFGGVGVDLNLRENLEKILKEEGKDKLYSILLEKDEKLAKTVDKENPRRVLRALEMAFSGGEKKQGDIDLDLLIFALTCDRAKLYQNINSRVDDMLEEGLVEEVKGLKSMGLTSEHQSMKAIGYKEVLDYLENKTTKEQMTELIKQHSRNYAKRQMTFLRGMENVEFVEKNEDAFKYICQKIEGWKNGKRKT